MQTKASKKRERAKLESRAKRMYTSIGIVIPTFQAQNHLVHCLTPLLNSPLKPRVLIIDSSSKDGTVDLARAMGVEAIVIPQSEFNHGATREKGRLYLGTQIIVMMTQDAYAESPDMLGRLIIPLIEGRASIAYAKQLPHSNAGIFGTFSRQFNYPDTSHIRSLSDASLHGAYTFFCSNSCAGYVNSALDQIGGFPSVLFGEDAIATAKLLRKGHSIAYVAEAKVYHSHDYTLKEEFCRHFDMGLSRRQYHDLFSFSGHSESSRGHAYVKVLLQSLWRESPFHIPYAILQSLAKWSGYRLGHNSLNASSNWKKYFSSQKHYWN